MTSHSERELLPANVQPINYAVRLEPDLEKFTYEGHVSIDVNVKEKSKSVTLNMVDIEIHNAKLSSETLTQAVAPVNTAHDEDKQTVEFSFDQELEAGSKAKLDISFSGTLNDKLCGFYRSVHTDEDGKKRVVATTQMEATDCRRAFPCFDEPALKATFDITLVTEKHLTALSNMDAKKESIEGDKKVTVFNRTPVMSTYLVAFIVGELNYVECNDFRVPVRVYATPGMEQRGKFSAELGAKTLEFFEKKFDVPYPLPKMDMVAIHDFSAGAMENWGLVTYRVVDLLFDEKTGSAASRQRVAEVVQHELAHQWFGNLVTMDWWEGLWLNEGFATWMSWYSCNSFYPQWRVWETYVGDDLQSSLSLDALRSSHPVEVPVHRADQVNEIFDAISYSKGSSIVKMVAEYLGEETFIKGISLYLKRHAYSNTQTIDLWKALTEVSGKDVVSVMSTWTQKVGFPVVTVEEKKASNDITVRQNRFLSTGDVKPEEDQTLYPLTLALRTKKGIDRSVMLTEREASLSIPEDSEDFYKLNADSSGLYRVKYPADRVAKLSQAGADGLLSVEDRVGLVADIASLSTSGYTKTSDLLTLLSLWKGEKESNVWAQIITRLKAVSWRFQEPKEVKKALEKFQRDLVVPQAKAVGWEFSESDGLLVEQLKSRLFSAAVDAEDQEFINIALDMFERRFVKGDSEAIHPNLRDAVFSAASVYGDDSVWQTLLDLYNSPQSSEEGVRAIRALGKKPSVDVRKKTLDLAFGGVRSQDIFWLLNSLSYDMDGCRMLWQWLQDNWSKLIVEFPPTMGNLGHIVSICSQGLGSDEDLDAFNKFFADKDTKGIEMNLANTRDRIASRSAWYKRDRDDVAQWLKEHNYL